jgi:hypothetical protein
MVQPEQHVSDSGTVRRPFDCFQGQEQRPAHGYVTLYGTTSYKPGAAMDSHFRRQVLLFGVLLAARPVGA